MSKRVAKVMDRMLSWEDTSALNAYIYEESIMPKFLITVRLMDL